MAWNWRDRPSVVFVFASVCFLSFLIYVSLIRPLRENAPDTAATAIDSVSPPSTETEIKKELAKNGYDNISVKRDAGTVDLQGTAPSQADKNYVEALAKSAADLDSPISNNIVVQETQLKSGPITEVSEVVTPRSTHNVVRVFYATDRKIAPLGSRVVDYENERADDEKVVMGTVDVSIPRGHKTGEMERPLTILRYEVRKEDPEKDIVVLQITPKESAQVFREIQTAVAASHGKEALIFIHGYYVSFQEAARRTAQIANDLSFDGAPIMYSWPSRDEFLGYPADEATIEWTSPHFKNFLEDIAAQSGATTIHVIAHSMGNRALANALNSIVAENQHTKHLFSEIFLAAPDIDAGVFKNLAAVFPKSADHVTLYASSKDKALILSKTFHQERRAGDSSVLTVVPSIDTIDATSVDTEFVGHSYFGDSRSILYDIFSVIKHYDPPNLRFGMKPNDPQKPTYWLFRP
jgi:esterase/lipase superfamily enzyme